MWGKPKPYFKPGHLRMKPYVPTAHQCLMELLNGDTHFNQVSHGTISSTDALTGPQTSSNQGGTLTEILASFHQKKERGLNMR